MRPILRPGTHVLRRGTGDFQIGLDPRAALVLPDSGSVRTTLRLLAASADRAEHLDDGTLDLLSEHRLLMDQRALAPLLSGSGGADLADRATAALARCEGGDAPAATRSRKAWRTQVRGFGHPAGTVLTDRLRALGRTAGLREVTPRQAAPPDGGVLLGIGEPDRELLDDWTRAGTPHLLVRMTEGRAVLGPFVVPGRTACLRCIDAHHTDADPSWPLLVRQYAAASSRDRADGAPEPVDPVLASLAVAWAVRDLLSYVEGRRPSTWSATVSLHPRLSELEARPWLRHPACCCTWD